MDGSAHYILNILFYPFFFLGHWKTSGGGKTNIGSEEAVDIDLVVSTTCPLNNDRQLLHGQAVSSVTINNLPFNFI